MDNPAAAEIQTHWRIKAWFPDLDHKAHAQLRTFFNELLKFNKTVNLISTKTLPNCDLLHFADSISACLIVDKKINENEELYDLGSGSGFPGIVYSILYPKQKIILVDFDERRTQFLNHVVTTLDLVNVKVETKKVESYGPDTISQAICRNFASLSKTLMILRKSVKLGGTVFNMKSDEWSMEVLQIPTQLCSSWRPRLIGEYKLPLIDTKLYIVEAVKI